MSVALVARGDLPDRRQYSAKLRGRDCLPRSFASDKLTASKVTASRPSVQAAVAGR